MPFPKSDSLFFLSQGFASERSCLSGAEELLRPRASAFSNGPAVKFRRQCRKAFSLAEVVIVMGIMTVLTGVSVPAIQGLTTSNSLNTGARKFADFLQLARNEAISRHTIVRAAIVTQWTGNPDDPQLRKSSLWSWDPELQQYFQTTPWETLPTGVVAEPALPDYVRTATYAVNDGSSVHGDYALDPNLGSQAEFTADTTQGSATMRFIEFLPNGGAQLPGGTSRNAIFVLTSGFLNADGSVTHTTTSKGKATNWAQLNVDTLTGRVRVYQP